MNIRVQLPPEKVHRNSGPQKYVCVYAVELRGCGGGAVTCVHQGGCRAGWHIYILFTNEGLIRRGGRE